MTRQREARQARTLVPGPTRRLTVSSASTPSSCGNTRLQIYFHPTTGPATFCSRGSVRTTSRAHRRRRPDTGLDGLRVIRSEGTADSERCPYMRDGTYHGPVTGAHRNGRRLGGPGDPRAGPPPVGCCSSLCRRHLVQFTASDRREHARRCGDHHTEMPWTIVSSPRPTLPISRKRSSVSTTPMSPTR